MSDNAAAHNRRLTPCGSGHARLLTNARPKFVVPSFSRNASNELRLCVRLNDNNAERCSENHQNSLTLSHFQQFAEIRAIGGQLSLARVRVGIGKGTGRLFVSDNAAAHNRRLTPCGSGHARLLTNARPKFVVPSSSRNASNELRLCVRLNDNNAERCSENRRNPLTLTRQNSLT